MVKIIQLNLKEINISLEELKVQKKIYAINEEQSEDMDNIDIESNRKTESSSENSDDNKLKFEDSIQIKNISLKIYQGEFIWIIGEVGSGKSSLLNAILGDMIYVNDDIIEEYRSQIINEDIIHNINWVSKKYKNQIKLNGSVSYVQQVPWIQNKTIRENIILLNHWATRRIMLRRHTDSTCETDEGSQDHPVIFMHQEGVALTWILCVDIRR